MNLIKGAPEKILPNCTNYYNEKGEKQPILDLKKIKNQINIMTTKGMRVLILATSTNSEPTNFKNITLVGIIAIKDEVRKEAIE